MTTTESTCEGGIVTVRIGRADAYREFIVCKAVIRTSRTLKGAIKAWKKSEPPVVDISWESHTDYVPFRTYKHFLYHTEIRTGAELDSGGNPWKRNAKTDYRHLVEAWFFGAHINDEVFMDMTMSRALELLRTGPTPSEHQDFVHTFTSGFVNLLINKPDPNQIMRRFIADALVRYAQLKDYQHFQQDIDYPKGFLARLMVAGAAFKEIKEKPIANTPSPAKPDNKLALQLASAPKPVPLETECVYHLHGQRRPCWRKMTEYESSI
jgi:hypothetical protein